MQKMPVVRAQDLKCIKVMGGKKPLWHAYHNSLRFVERLLEHHIVIIGAANTADNAIKDWQKQYRRHFPAR